MTIRKETRTFQPTNEGVEKPREVYLAACASIGAHLASVLGFTYAKSGPRATRRRGELELHIGFQSSFHNVAGRHVRLCVHAGVHAARIKAWRSANGSQAPHTAVAGGQLGNLRHPPTWIDWEFADPATRRKTTGDVIGAIEEIALPFFARFDDLPALYETIVAEDVPGLAIDRAIELLLAFDQPGGARRAGVGFLARRPDLVDAYREALRRRASEDADRIPSGFAEKLADYSLRFELGVLA